MTNSIPDEVTELFPICLIIPAAMCPWGLPILTEIRTRNLSAVKPRQAPEADNLTVIFEPIF
jgi:hypothetical protein